MLVEGVVNWIEQNVPLVGPQIAEGISKFSDALEEAVKPIRDTVDNVSDTVRKHISDTSENIRKTVSRLSDQIDRSISPNLDSLRREIDKLGIILNGISTTLSEFLNDPIGFISSHLPDWVRESINSLWSNVSGLWNSISKLRTEFDSWVNGASQWFKTQLQTSAGLMWSIVYPFIKPHISFILWFSTEFKDFLTDPKGWVEKHLPDWVKNLPNKINELITNFDTFVKGAIDAVMHIDDFLREKMWEIVIGFIEWNIKTLLWDLTHIKYDPMTGEIEGEPRHPVTWILIKSIEFFTEPEKPKVDYEDASWRMGVKKLG